MNTTVYKTEPIAVKAWTEKCNRYQGRTASYPTAPSQVPACGIIAPGFSKPLALHAHNDFLIPRE
ncbi:MAG: hypothetical protein PHD43_19490, partial [Methylococcales bacterium]|nr:hypothetical protein [Methylococcales bacterium]